MAQTSAIPTGDTGSAEPDAARVGDMAAMLRVMRPLAGSIGADRGRRQLLADLCRLIGLQVGAVAAPADPLSTTTGAATGPGPVGPGPCGPPAEGLSPRLAQVLDYLLAGDSEKQVARRMKLSHHTVHGHVKILYRRYGVSSRAELLARHLRRDPPAVPGRDRPASDRPASDQPTVD